MVRFCWKKSYSIQSLLKKNSRCPNCSGILKIKDLRQKIIYSMLGKTLFKRPRYKCTECGFTYIPADTRLDLGKGFLSKLLVKNLSLISIFVPFDHALKFIKDTLSLDLSKRLLQNSIYRIGKTLSDYFSEELKEEERREILESEPESIDTAYVQVDGSFVPSISENPEENTSKMKKNAKVFKENKLGVIFTSNNIEKREVKIWSGEHSNKE